jgi:NAD(P)-dependent dehydrogenase (short-subunit alcohol dehydrogenase family)
MTLRTLVTGATRGPGLAICTRLAGQGHDIIGIARRPDPTFTHALHNV